MPLHAAFGVTDNVVLKDAPEVQVGNAMPQSDGAEDGEETAVQESDGKPVSTDEAAKVEVS